MSKEILFLQMDLIRERTLQQLEMITEESVPFGGEASAAF
jgi:hypothetical protein